MRNFKLGFRWLLVCFLGMLSIPFVQAQNCSRYAELTAANVTDIQLIYEWEALAPNFSGLAALSHAGDLLAIGRGDNQVLLMNPEDFAVQARFDLAAMPLDFMNFDATDRYLALGSHQAHEYQIIALETMTVVQEYQFTDMLWTSVDSHFNWLLTVSNDGELVIYDPLTGNDLFTASHISTLPAINATGERLALMNNDGLIEIWDIQSHERLHLFESSLPEGSISAFGFMDLANLIWISWDDWQLFNSFSSFVEFRDLETGSQAFVLGEDSNVYNALANDTAGNFVLIQGALKGMSQGGSLFDLRSQTLLDTFPMTGGAFSPNSDFIVTVASRDFLASIYRLEPYEALMTLNLKGGIKAPQFSSDGRLLLTQGAYIQLWGVLSNCS